MKQPRPRPRALAGSWILRQLAACRWRWMCGLTAESTIRPPVSSRSSRACDSRCRQALHREQHKLQLGASRRSRLALPDWRVAADLLLLSCPVQSRPATHAHAHCTLHSAHAIALLALLGCLQCPLFQALSDLPFLSHSLH